jgi:hypothetical protein
MKVFLAVLIGGISFLSHGQEGIIQTIAIEWGQLSAPLVMNKKELITEKYTLQKVDLTIDLRQQAFKKKYTMYIELPKYKNLSSKHTTIISPKSKTSGFTITGNVYGINKPSLSGNLKNTAYKDAGIYTGTYFSTVRQNYYSRHLFSQNN